MAENIFFEVPDEILAKAAETDVDVNSCNVGRKEKEEKKVGNRFVELSEDDLEKIVDRSEAKATKNTTKWGVKIFEGKDTTRKKTINCSNENHLLQLSAHLQQFAPRNVNKCNDKQNG